MTTIKASIIENKKYALFIILWLLGGSVLTLSLSYLFSSLFILSLGIFFFVVGILFFEKKLQSKFSKEVLLNLSEDYFEIIINEDNSQEIKIDFIELNSFKATGPSKDKSIIIKMQLNNLKCYKWVFMENRKLNGNISILDVLFKNVNDYNKRHLDKRISLIPNFFATRKGLLYIILLGVITVCILIIQIFNNPKSILFSGIFIFVFYIIILQQRKNDLEQIKRLE